MTTKQIEQYAKESKSEALLWDHEQGRYVQVLPAAIIPLGINVASQLKASLFDQGDPLSTINPAKS